MCFPVIVCHAVYVTLNLRVNLKAYFPIMKGETMETRLTGDVTDSDNVSPAHYCFFKFSRAKRVGIGKLSNLRLVKKMCQKRAQTYSFCSSSYILPCIHCPYSFMGYVWRYKCIVSCSFYSAFQSCHEG